jgi:peptidoglycan-associated lipoprotein
MMRISLAAAILAFALLPACQTSRDVAPNKEISQSGALKVHPGLIKDQPAKPAAAPEPAQAN